MTESSLLCFLCRTGSALALLYGTSATLEHHHFNHAVMILQSEVRSIFLYNYNVKGLLKDLTFHFPFIGLYENITVDKQVLHYVVFI